MGNFLFWRNGYGRNGIAVFDFRFDPHPGHQIGIFIRLDSTGQSETILL